MRRLVYAEQAVKDAEAILAYLAEASGDRSVAENFVATLYRKCRRLAELEATIGRPRSELGEGYRSFAAGNYVIFFRYLSGTVAILRILERHRDATAAFRPEADG